MKINKKIDKKILKKPLLFLKKYKELIELRNSMTKEEVRLLLCSLEYKELYEKYPEFIKL